MNYLVGCFIFVTLMVCTLIFIIVAPKHKYYFSPEIYPFLSNLNQVENFEQIKKECSDISDTIILYSNNTVENNIINKFTNTYNLLRTIPDVRNIFLTVLKPKTKTTRHKGSADLANWTLRCILPIEISHEKKTGVWVDGKNKFYEENQWIIYDNSRENNTFNTNKLKKTVLLVVDIDRPTYVPRGISVENNNRLL